MAALSESEMRILSFDKGWWRRPGAKEQAIADLFGLSATRYYQLLNELIDRPEALRFDPALINRLRRQRARRPRMRPARPSAAGAGRHEQRPGGSRPDDGNAADGVSSEPVLEVVVVR